MHARLLWGGIVVIGTVAALTCTDEIGPTVSERFAATLTGAAERPTPVVTTATGSAEFEIIDGVPGIHFTLSVAGIDSVTAAHIHGPADTGNPAGVLSFMFAGAATGLDVTGVLSEGVISAASGITFDSLVALLRSGNSYVNVHTRVNGGGEIRGQIFPQ